MFIYLRNSQTQTVFTNGCTTISKFSTFLPTFAVIWLFDPRHPSGCEVVSPSDFGLYFLMINVLISPLYFFLGELSFQSLCIFLIDFFFMINIFQIQVLLDDDLQIFLAFYGLSVHFPDDVLSGIKIFKFDNIQFIYCFSFVPCVFNVKSKNTLPNPGSERFIPMFSSTNFTVLALTFRSLIILS